MPTDELASERMLRWQRRRIANGNWMMRHAAGFIGGVLLGLVLMAFHHG